MEAEYKSFVCWRLILIAFSWSRVFTHTNLFSKVVMVNAAQKFNCFPELGAVKSSYRRILSNNSFKKSGEHLSGTVFSVIRALYFKY